MIMVLSNLRLCCAHKLHETWDGICELLEESNLQPFEARGGDPTNYRFQVSADALEPIEAKVRKCIGCRDWHVRELASPHHGWEQEMKRRSRDSLGGVYMRSIAAVYLAESRRISDLS